MNPSLRLICLLTTCAATSATAAVTYSGTQNIPIPSTFAGISITLDRSDAAIYSIDTSATNTSGAGWDLNFFLGGAGIANSPNAQPVRDTTANLSFVHNLFPATTVDASSTYSSAYGGSGFPNQHIGGGANQFTNATSGYIGFVLDAGTASPLYGWMKVTLDNSGNTGVIESWAFEDTPNTAIQVALVPEPGSTLLILIASAATLLRRRRL